MLIGSSYNARDVIQGFTGKGLAGFVQRPLRGSLLVAKVLGTPRSRG